MRFRAVNLGLIIAMLINFIISLCIVETFVEFFAENNYLLGFGITVAVFAISIGILFTPIGDWWYRRIVHHLREPNEWEKRRLEPIYQEVYDRVLELAPNLTEDIELYIYDDDSVNAFAVGLRTIAVHRGMLISNLHDDEIAAILGHEFAHIVNGDTLCSTLAYQSNAVVFAFRAVLAVIIKIAAIIIGFFISIVGSTEREAEDTVTIAGACGKLVAWITDKFLFVIVAIGIIIAQHSRRRNELQADVFSAELGYGRPLLRCFQRWEEEGEPKREVFSLAYLMHGTHPSLERRIENLRAWIAVSRQNYLQDRL